MGKPDQKYPYMAGEAPKNQETSVENSSMTISEARIMLAAINASMANGVKSVEANGRTTTYQSTSDMLILADRLRRDIAKMGGKPAIVITTWAGTK